MDGIPQVPATGLSTDTSDGDSQPTGIFANTETDGACNRIEPATPVGTGTVQQDEGKPQVAARDWMPMFFNAVKKFVGFVIFCAALVTLLYTPLAFYIANKISQNQLEPKLFVEGILVTSGSHPSVRISVTNSGSVEIKNVAITSEEFWLSYPPLPPPESSNGEECGIGVADSSPVDLAVGQTIYLEHSVERENLGRLRRRTMTLHAQGEVIWETSSGEFGTKSFSFVQGGKFDPNSPEMTIEN